ncbi:hypothetical protein NE539_02090 [Flavonifractor plautii]|jgi:hypothetical protein|uniref:structural cement protein Gp24 n=1 Tax=Flavonifractor plautii TaxID=292800 RepID=UPI002062E460|nr:hypothetical protein [Flavonifractor plautii]MCQ4992090.1 hypothetical protein [Flavonifractor plautii]DAY55450.1 MAG TPA: hypothetical protein [Caudoviricetes sp.]
MSVQTRYGYATPIGAAGGIVDLAPYAVDTFLNEEDSGKMKFGMGVVRGSKPGTNVALPKTGATAEKFEGVTVNNRTTEYDMEGKAFVRKGAGIGVMRYGRVYVRVEADDEPEYGDPLLLIINGDEAGCFTSTEDSGNTMAVNGRFIGGVDNGIAPIELMRQPVTGAAAASGATKLGDLSDVDLTTSPTDGQVLKYENSSSKWKAANDETGGG